jgi:hypothetical protein
VRDRQAVLLPTYRDGGRFVNNHNVLVHVNYGDRVGGNGDFMPETNQQCRVDTITHSTGGRGMKLILYCKNTVFMTLLLSYYFVVACTMSNEVNICIRTGSDSKITHLLPDVKH